MSTGPTYSRVSDWDEAVRINLTADPMTGAAGHFILMRTAKILECREPLE